ncbi:MAG: SOS response-associated peptidase [Myxococcota bacterium]
MCGRFTLTSSPEALARHFDLDELPQLAPRYNVAPGQDVAAIRRPVSGGQRTLELLRWGLVPSWAVDPRVGQRMINARAETAAERPAYRKALRQRRCLVAADGFYEWAGGRGARQPYHIGFADGGPFGIAGLWAHWIGRGGEVIESCTLLTTRANERVARLHDRMPVILPPEDYALWLDPSVREVEQVLPLLRPCAAEALEVRPVSHQVNDPKHDDPSCIARVEPPLTLL